MLLRQDGGGREDGDLAARLRGLEGGPEGDFGLAESHVAADQPVHRAAALHVGLGLVDRAQLVGGFDERERGLELLLPGRVRREGEAGLGLALGLDREELGGQVEGGPLGRPPGLFPAAGADPPQLGLGLAQARHSG